MLAFGASDRGTLRRRNEDRWLVEPLGDDLLLMAVADGMGGEPAGDVAAQTVVNALEAMARGQSPSRLRDLARNRPRSLEALLAGAVAGAERAIRGRVASNPELSGMGATVTAVLAPSGERGGQAAFVHAGDSRLYLWRGGSLAQVTTDHTAAQDLVDQGLLSPEQAREHPMGSLLQRCVGCHGGGPDTGSLELRPGDRLLVCTDGLHKELAPEDIGAVMALDLPPADTARALIGRALAAGGHDNVTVVAARVDRA